MKLEEFEKELQGINKDLSIRLNNPPKRVVDAFPDVLKLASITFQGEEICTVPSGEIFDQRNENYGIDLRGDGRFVPHRTRLEALEIVKNKLKLLENKEEADAFFGRGEYSDAALMKKDVVPEIVEEVKGNVTEVHGGMLEE